MKLSLILSLVLCQTAQVILAQGVSTFSIIKERVYLDVSKAGINDDEQAKKNLKTLSIDGNWDDIDYKSTAVTTWQPTIHLDRITEMLKAYTNKKGQLYSDLNLYNGISKGLQFWYNTDPKSSNWWHNEISVPQKLGVALIIASYGKIKLPEHLSSNLLERMKRGIPQDKTGANKTDIATHYFYRALLTADVELLAFSVSQLFEPVQLVDGKEGLQYDFSYLQHGPQLYIAGYGEVYITGVLKLANYVKGTSYALSENQLALFSRFYQESYLRLIRGNYIDFSVHGRGISRKDILKKSEKNNLEDLQRIDPAHKEDLDTAIRRFSNPNHQAYGIKPYHQHFWKADYAVHVRPNYLFTVRTSSSRTKRTEAGNNENLYGRYLPDGATNIQVQGSEYFNIMPIWEWDKIPGITSRNYSQDRAITAFWGELGANAFSGGVSDGLYGAAAYQLNYDSVSAKKAWFFFDNEIVCLGAGISSHTKENITTTINQAWLKGNVHLSNHPPLKSEKSIDYEAKNGSWVYHANTGYYFPNGGELSLSTQKQTGNWFKINHSYNNETVTGDVFKLWINHGRKPIHSQYAYIVLPGIKDKKEVKKYDSKTINTIANTKDYQVVYHQRLRILQAVFYTPSKVESEAFAISVDEPCILMLREGKSMKNELFISDPLFKNKSITITYTDKSTGKSTQLKVELPTGPYLGSTKKVVF